jgi:hypothetical protein
LLTSDPYTLGETESVAKKVAAATPYAQNSRLARFSQYVRRVPHQRDGATPE